MDGNTTRKKMKTALHTQKVEDEERRFTRSRRNDETPYFVIGRETGKRKRIKRW